jgi:choline dehydrogenase-like flavoprotein
MGTAPMGRDPSTSVVNAWNRAHDVPNLFIVDGSSFTTAAAVNPTSTIGALALRAAEGIWQQRKEWS